MHDAHKHNSHSGTSGTDAAALDKPLTTKEAADFLGVSKSWLEHRRCDGTGPAYIKYRHLVRYKPQKLREYQDALSRTRVWDFDGENA